MSDDRSIIDSEYFNGIGNTNTHRNLFIIQRMFGRVLGRVFGRMIGRVFGSGVGG